MILLFLKYHRGLGSDISRDDFPVPSLHLHLHNLSLMPVSCLHLSISATSNKRTCYPPNEGKRQVDNLWEDSPWAVKGRWRKEQRKERENYGGKLPLQTMGHERLVQSHFYTLGYEWLSSYTVQAHVITAKWSQWNFNRYRTGYAISYEKHQVFVIQLKQQYPIH